MVTKAHWVLLKKLLKNSIKESGIGKPPFFHSIRNYDKAKAWADLKASFNVTLVSTPQCMAYAVIAGLPVQYGLMGGIVACIIGALFWGSRYIVPGPSNTTALIVASAFMLLQGEADPTQLVSILVAMVGIFLIAGSLMRVDNILRFVSRTVITGYISAAGILIIANQIHQVFGFRLESGSYTFWDVAGATIQSIEHLNPTAVILSLTTALIYVTASKRVRYMPPSIFTLLFCMAIAYILTQAGGSLLYLHPVSLSDVSFGFGSFNWDHMNKLAGSALAIAFIIILESISIGKTLASQAGKKMAVNQEVLSLGIANFGSAFFGAMPASGSPTRSALNINSGAQTIVAVLMNGLLQLGIFFLLGAYIGYIPEAGLAVIVIFIGLSLIDFKQIRLALRTTYSDAIVFVVTFLSALLLPLNLAIYLGVGISIVLLLNKVATPYLFEYTLDEKGFSHPVLSKEDRVLPEISMIDCEGNLFFGASEIFQEQMRKSCEDQELKVVILRLRNAHHMDATSVGALQELMHYLRLKGKSLILSGVNGEVLDVFRDSGLIQEIGSENLFPDTPRNPSLATKRAYARALEILGVCPVKKIEGV
jgi:SulP family sulfate permease